MKLEPAFKRRIFCLVLFVLAGAVAAQAPKPMSPHEKAARDLYRLLGGQELAKSRAEALVRAMYDNRSSEDEGRSR